METTTQKYDLNKMKIDLIDLSYIQKILKNQRKDVHIVGERLMPAKEATWKHAANREKLRLMFAAYGLMRGKPFTKTEENTKWEKVYLDSTFAECHPLNKYKNQIDKILEMYTIKEEVEKK